jgi:demethylmenaquinone methyltransferase/2-methoxy-6-polyprenyl-1,4-benzoquinol methylase
VGGFTQELFRFMTQNPSSEASARTHFGERTVAWDEKAPLVRGVFERVATRYDLMNDVMSGGMHRLWKQHFVSCVRGNAESTFLDVAGGTGDIATRIHARFNAPVMVCDINEAMLNAGRARGIDTATATGLRYLCGNAESLPVTSDSVDVYTIAFGIRNVTDIPAALREAHRVLKSGGQFLCLEFSPEVTPLLKPLYDAYSFKLLPRLGKWIAKDRESYQYLAESIRRFPTPTAFEQMLRIAGLARTRVQPLSGGICAIHQGVKL